MGDGVRTGDGAQELAGKVLDMMPRKRRKVVLLEKVVDAHPQQLADDADVVAVVEPAEEVYAFTAQTSSVSQFGERRRVVGEG